MLNNHRTLIRGARQVLTLRGEGGPRRGAAMNDVGLILDGSILLHNDVIEAVGPTRRIENMTNARGAREIDATGKVAMPAFVDCQACICPVPALTGKGGKEITKLVRGSSASRLEAQTGRVLRIMARHGTATIAAMSGYGADAACELKILKVLKALDRFPLDIVAVANQVTPQQAGLLASVAQRKLAGFAGFRCGEHALSLATAAAGLAEAHALGFKLRLEGHPPHEAALIELAVQAGAVSISNVHTRRMAEIEILANSSTFSIQMPARKELELPGGGTRDLVDSGALVALASGLTPDLQGTASMQTVVARAVEILRMTPAEAVSAATINAAWAIGQGSKTGSLEHGKRADILLLNASDYREIPSLCGTNLTHCLIKRGVILFEEEFPGWPERD